MIQSYLILADHCSQESSIKKSSDFLCTTLQNEKLSETEFSFPLHVKHCALEIPTRNVSRYIPFTFNW